MHRREVQVAAYRRRVPLVRSGEVLRQRRRPGLRQLHGGHLQRLDRVNGLQILPADSPAIPSRVNRCVELQGKPRPGCARGGGATRFVNNRLSCRFIRALVTFSKNSRSFSKTVEVTVLCALHFHSTDTHISLGGLLSLSAVSSFKPVACGSMRSVRRAVKASRRMRSARKTRLTTVRGTAKGRRGRREWHTSVECVERPPPPTTTTTTVHRVSHTSCSLTPPVLLPHPPPAPQDASRTRAPL